MSQLSDVSFGVIEISSAFERVEVDAAPKLGDEVSDTVILVSSLEEPAGLLSCMFSFGESLVVDVISRRVSVLFPVDLWFKSSLSEFVVFDVNSSLTGSAEDDFRSLDELTDGEVLTLAAWCGVDADGARPLAA